MIEQSLCICIIIHSGMRTNENTVTVSIVGISPYNDTNVQQQHCEYNESKTLTEEHSPAVR